MQISSAATVQARCGAERPHREGGIIPPLLGRTVAPARIGNEPRPLTKWQWLLPLMIRDPFIEWREKGSGLRQLHDGIRGHGTESIVPALRLRNLGGGDRPLVHLPIQICCRPSQFVKGCVITFHEK